MSIPCVCTCLNNVIIFRMLEEILGTRIMVKNSMKQHKGNKVHVQVQGLVHIYLHMIIQEAVIIGG